jgi:predicted secreted hydrolase
LTRLWIPLSALLPLLLLSACGVNRDTPLATGTPQATPTRAAAAFVAPTPEIVAVRFPEDEAPHDMLTEWWYYTGHMYTEEGRRYGFEYVIFQGIRGQFPPYYASHFAITDAEGDRFYWAEKDGPNAIREAERGFALELDGWSMSGALGEDHLVADMDGFAIDLRLSATKPPVLHNDIGYVDFGPAGGSYYYSRTRMDISGTLSVDDEALAVTGEAWFDHQWGNFISVGAGGWDWFSVQLENGEDLTISLVLDEDKSVIMSYGTFVLADGTPVHLEPGDFTVNTTDTWTSPHSGATYPSRWTIELPEQQLTLDLVPTVADQELQTIASTNVTYWEGEVEVSGTRDGESVAGLGYVELTGYAMPQQ